MFETELIGHGLQSRLLFSRGVQQVCGIRFPVSGHKGKVVHVLHLKPLNRIAAILLCQSKCRVASQMAPYSLVSDKSSALHREQVAIWYACQD